MARGARRKASPRASVVAFLVAAVGLTSMAGCFGSDTPAESSGGPGDEGPRFGPFPEVDIDEVEITNRTVESFDGTGLAVTVFRPPHATAERPVPVIMHSPGLGGVRWSGIEEGDTEGWPVSYVESGFVLISQQHRGVGDSEGTFTMHLPEVHGRDTAAIMDWLADQPYVAQDAPGDPVIGMIGASSGGMAQLVAALQEVEEAGATRIDSMAPHAAPFSFNESLAPNDVPRSLWWDLIMGMSISDPDLRMDPEVMQIGAHVIATSAYPDGTAGLPDGKEYFWQRSAKRLVMEQGSLDVPMVVARSMTDSAVHFQQTIAAYQTALTEDAFEESHLVADYVGVHRTIVLAPPAELNSCSDAWGGSIWELMLRFHRIQLLGESADLGPPIQLSTRSECMMLEDLPPVRWMDVDGTMLATSPMLTLEGPEPAFLPVEDGPIRFAGVPKLNATVSVAPPDARLFFALFAGPSPDEAWILGDQWMPLQLDGPGGLEGFNLAGVASTVESDETLYVVVARWVDQFAHDQDRRTAPVVLEDIEIGLPVVDESVMAQVTQQQGPDDLNLGARP